ncbi:hypothetical protein TRFO_23706 [Tritrichomonas foetus]|uniref:DUF3447 domain-containing protein n=1 Tax=Tritrichomonas foetus TaxID=1144522 RepID=A0A1J4KF43_9EUKA|nr:hypothetical protein TRFO_23706 [Tritrichomonas foetus]|eukprot:OHT07997.1 hypothetical protein TRFO_23706 [Tritrichomonas foetus]
MLSAIEDDHVEELKQYIQKYSIDIHCYYEVPIPIIKLLFKKHPKITLLMYSAYCCSKKCFEYLFNNSSLEDITQNEYNKKMTHHNFKIMGLTIQVSSIVDYSIIGGSLDILKLIANVKNIEFSVSHLIFSIIMHNIDMFEYIIKNITFCATKEFAVFCIIYHFIHGYQHIKQCNLRDMIAYSCMFGNYTFLDTSFQKWKEETIDTIYYLDLKSPFYEIMNWILLKKRQTQKYTDCSVYSIVDACLSNNIDLLNLLIKENADINEVSLNKKTNTARYLLQIVCLRGYIDLFNVLIEHSKINLHLYQIHAVITPLMAASFGKNLSIVERIYNLCPETLNIGIKNGKFQIEIFPLTVAILSRRNDVAKYLLSLPNINIDSLSILKCLDQENIEIFQKMISLDEVKYHKLWTSSNLKQDSPLMKIIQKENIEMIKLIIYNSSVDINALHYLCAAVELGNIDIVKIICSQPKIDMHKKDL